LPAFRKKSIKKTLIFDLDETLMHCVDDISSDNPEVVIKITFPGGQKIDVKSKFNFIGWD
jgi:hypothetical protein